MSTLASGIALASSLVTSVVPAEVSVTEYVAQQIKQEAIVMQQEFFAQLINDVANTTHQFSLEENTIRHSVTIKDLDSKTAE